MQHTPRFKRIALAIGLAGAFGAVTAFGVAPLTELQLPPIQYVTAPLQLELQTPESLDRFTQVETIRKGDSIVFTKPGAPGGRASRARKGIDDAWRVPPAGMAAPQRIWSSPSFYLP